MVKIVFDSPEGGRVSAETLWASTLSDDRFRVCNIPVWVNDIALDDVIIARRDENNGDRLHFVNVAERSGNLTCRVFILDGVNLESDEVVKARQQIKDLTDGAEHYSPRYAAYNVAPNSDRAALRKLLQQGEEQGWWAYEEANGDL
jgi:hypothetical protein